MITRVRMMAIAAPMPMAITVRPRRRESQMVRAISASVTSGRIQVSRSNHWTAVWAGPSASDWSRVIWPKSDGSGLPDQFATSWMAASGVRAWCDDGRAEPARQGARQPAVHPYEDLADQRQEVEVDVAALDVDVGRLPAEQGDDLLVPDAVDLEPQVVGFGRAQHLLRALLDEVLQRAGDRTGEEPCLLRQRVAHTLLQVGRGDSLAGDVATQVLDGLRVLADRPHQVHVAVGVHHRVVGPQGQAADDHGEAAEEHEEADQDAPHPAGSARGRASPGGESAAVLSSAESAGVFL